MVWWTRLGVQALAHHQRRPPRQGCSTMLCAQRIQRRGACLGNRPSQARNTYPWERFEACNKCALACYLEPSLFSWRNLSNVNERILHGMFSYIASKTGLKHVEDEPNDKPLVSAKV